MPKNATASNTTRPVLEVIGGVDTHGDTHAVAALDQVGGLLGTTIVPATPAGYRQALVWLTGFGPAGRVGVEGTGSYGAGLTRFLLAAGIEVIEVNRPNRATRRARGKSDPLDAEQAARAVLAGTATARPKTRDGIVESIRVLHLTRRGAVKAKTAALNEFNALLVTAPDELRTTLTAVKGKKRLTLAAALRPGDISQPLHATKLALRRLARRIANLQEEINEAKTELARLTAKAAPELRAEYGVGPDSTAQLLITAGDNLDRLRSEAAFAALCGTSPLPASSGKTNRHRLNRGGDRQANRALHTIVLTRMRSHQPTCNYIADRADHKTRRDLIRQLKRYLARRVYHILTNTLDWQTGPPTALDNT